jgi:hypothetical protein
VVTSNLTFFNTKLQDYLKFYDHGVVLHWRTHTHVFNFLHLLSFLSTSRSVSVQLSPLWRNSPTPARAASFVMFLDHTQ